MQYTNEDRLENLRRSAVAACRQEQFYLATIAWCLRHEWGDLRRQLSADMSLADVRALLRGWTETPPEAGHSPDKKHLYFTADFLPPPHIDSQPWRLTFDNGRLLVWGVPAERPEHTSRDAAG